MIGPEYCVVMARYNTWQNSQLRGFLEALEPDELSRDRGAFFGSILSTLNHLLWGDTLWTSRFDGGEAPKVSGEEGLRLFDDLSGWSSARKVMDARICAWADGVSEADLQGDMVFHSATMNREMRKPMGLCVMQVFNHQTHHRGQVHAMLTATGSEAPVSDIAFMPDAV